LRSTKTVSGSEGSSTPGLSIPLFLKVGVNPKSNEKLGCIMMIVLVYINIVRCWISVSTRNPENLKQGKKTPNKQQNPPANPKPRCLSWDL